MKQALASRSFPRPWRMASGFVSRSLFPLKGPAQQLYLSRCLGSSCRGATLPLSRVARSFPVVRRLSTERSTPEPGPAPSFAFAFDIDGVLLHVSKPIPGAVETLRYLHAHSIPFILLTNGGGKHELERVQDLTAKLGVPLTTANFVQSHTPFQSLVEGPNGLKDKNILVTGSDAQKARLIAEKYGFRNVVTPADILAAHPGVWPFEPLLEEVYGDTARPLPKTGKDGEGLKIDAMFVFNDPRDWALDTQLIVDLLLSKGGYLGTYSDKNGNPKLANDGWQADGQPALYFSNADLFWATGYHLPRFGQGAFQAAVCHLQELFPSQFFIISRAETRSSTLETFLLTRENSLDEEMLTPDVKVAGVWEKVTGGRELRRRVVGKPHGETYKFAERTLVRHRGEMLKDSGEQIGGLRRVYMVGDNPESDIAGANEYQSQQGTEWCSVLVRTGVWHQDRGEMKHRPEVIVDDVREGVKWALEREGWKGRF